MTKRITLKDIAKSLNISIGTVERAIHDKHDINVETKKLILDKIQEMNYKPNKFARSLSVKNKKNLAVIIPNNSDFWYRMKAGIEYAEREFSWYGTHVEYICLNHPDGNIVLSYLKNLREKNYDGVIIVPSNLEDVKETINEYIDDGLDISLLNDDVPGLNRLFYIGPDNNLVGNLAGELIGKLSRGKGKCLVVTGANIKSNDLPIECKQRVAGFKHTIDTEYSQIEIDLCVYRMYVEDAYTVTLKKLKEDTEISCIYSVDGYLNETSMAVNEFGKKDIVLVGHEMSQEVNKQLAKGTVSAAICQNPFLQGYYMYKYMAEYLIDRKAPQNDKIFIDFNIFTKYNTYGKDNYISDMRNYRY